MPRIEKIEKSKDFKGSIIKLIKSLKKYYPAIILSLVLAMVSAILSLIAPNKLSTISDYITIGLKPNTEKITEINNKIIINTLTNYYNYNGIKLDVPETISTNEINTFKSLNNNELNNFMAPITIDNITLSKEEQLLFINGNYNDLSNDIYNLIKGTIDIVSIKKVSLILAILYIISAITNYYEQIIMALTSNKYGYETRDKISQKINKLPLKYFDTYETGDVLSRVTNDVDTMAMNLSQNLSSLVANITLFLGSILMMFITNYIMAITGILASIIGFIFMFMILGKSQKYFIERQEQLGDLNGYIEEIYSGHNVVLSNNAINKTNKEFDKLNNKLFKSSRMSQFLSGVMQPLMGFVGNLSYVAVCIMGAILVMNNKITFGVIVAFMIYVRMFTRPLSQIAQSMTSFQSIAAASERVFEFLDEKEMPDENDIRKHLDKSKVKGNIEFKNINFCYDHNKTIIHNFSAKVKSGQKVALVGPTGAGKTTMVNLLMKFYDLDDGDILIDGVSTKELSRSNIHDLFCMVLQDTWLFDGTIGDNIRYNKKDVTDAEIWSVCKTLGLDHFIKTLPNGLDAPVNDNESISSGQKQLITIARGMIEDAPFLILDEATSNVDTRTEELVQKAMDKLTEGRTSFIIAHRLSTIKNADLILVINNGNIVEKGTHQELLKKKGFYYNLYNSQFNEF